jgi:hypothetical protein
MDPTVTITGLQELKEALEYFEADLNMGARRAVVAAITEGENQARSNHRFESRTGLLERTIYSEITSEIPGEPEGEFVAPAPYASHVNYGTKPHPITPRHADMLKWQDDEGWHFHMEVNHPGTQPDPFMTDAANWAELVLNNEMQAEVESACRKFEGT